MNPSDAQALQGQGALPDTDSAGNPVTQGSNASTVNAMFPNIPAGSPIVAGPIPTSIPGAIASVVGDGIGAVAAPAFNGALANTDVSSTGVSTKSNPETTAADALKSRLDLTPTAAAAQGATSQIGQIEGPQAQQAGQNLQNSGQNLMQQGQASGAQAEQARNLAIAQSNQALTQAESDLQTASAKAQINPQQYLQNMGVGQRTMTALGLLISGAGSGLTGQPNLANEMLQNNINRDIDSQKQSYLNAYNQFTGSNAASQTALQRANAATAAQNMATLTVNTGASIYTAGLQTKLAGLTSTQRATITNNLIQQQMVAAKQNIDSQYITAAQSGDTATSNMLAGMAKIAADYANKGGSNRFTLNPAKGNSASQMNFSGQPYQPPASETPQAAAVPQQETSKHKSFLDRLSDVFTGNSQAPVKTIHKNGTISDD